MPRSGCSALHGFNQNFKKMYFSFFVMFWYRDFQAKCKKLCHERWIIFSESFSDGIIIAGYNELHGKLRLDFVWAYSA